MRESSSGCKDAEDTPVCSKEQKGQRQKTRKHMSVSMRMGKPIKEGKKYGIYLQQEPKFYLGVQLRLAPSGCDFD
jgi:hypothetical protein